VVLSDTPRTNLREPVPDPNLESVHKKVISARPRNGTVLAFTVDSIPVSSRQKKVKS